MYILVVGGGIPNEKYPGNGIFEFDQAKALAKYGHRVIYLAIDLRSIRRWRRWGYDLFFKDGIEVFSYSFPLGAVSDKILDFVGQKSFGFLYKIIEVRFGKPDIVHAHFGSVAIYVADFCKKNNIPFVITEHSSAMNKEKVPSKLAQRYGQAYKKANAVLAVGTTLAYHMEKNTGVSAIVVPNMVDISSFSFCKNSRIILKPFTFISAGYLVKNKGFDILIKAFAIFCKRHNNSILKIMGDGPERGVLQDLSIELGIDNHIEMTGAYVRNEFNEALQKADCFALATRWETFGVVFIEAMATGVPIIATKCGGPEDFVTPEVGVLVPVDDVCALVNAMEDIYKNIFKYDKNIIRESVLQRFSSQTIAKRLTEEYKNILN